VDQFCQFATKSVHSFSEYRVKTLVTDESDKQDKWTGIKHYARHFQRENISETVQDTDILTME